MGELPVRRPVTQYSPSHYRDIGERLFELYWSNYAEMLRRYPEHRQHPDLRASLFSMPGNALLAYRLAMHAMDSTLHDENWWVTSTSCKTEEQILDAFGHHETTMRLAYYVIFVSRYEWVLRNMLVALDRNACSGGLAEYKSIYDCLFRHLDLAHLTHTFDVARHLRNTVHNNGTYCSKSGKDSPVYVYRARNIQFQQGVSIGMATELSFQVIEDLILAAREIVDSPRISALASAPFALSKNVVRDPRDAGS